MQTLKSTAAMSDAMNGVTRTMQAMNKGMDLPAMQKIMREFEKETEQMDMKEEMMGDAIDDVMEASDEEEEADNVLNSVLDEIGINLNGELADAPSQPVPAAAQATAVKDTAADDALQARLENLRR